MTVICKTIEELKKEIYDPKLSWNIMVLSGELTIIDFSKIAEEHRKSLLRIPRPNPRT